MEGFHHLAEQTLKVQDFLHEEAFDGRLLSAGRVDALSRLPPNQDLVFELWGWGGQNKQGRVSELSQRHRSVRLQRELRLAMRGY